MRKIYSLVLMAAALLVGTNVWATLHDTKSASDEVQITTITYDLSDPSNPVESTRTTLYGTLDEAVATTINDAATDSVQIKLLKTITRSESVGFFGGRVELNLDTFRILMPVSAPANGRNTVQLFKGILHIKANKVDGHQGSIICDKSSGGGVWDGAAIQVHGANDDEANYAILKVDANVRVLGQTRGVYLYVVENNTNGNAIIANNPSYITDNTSVTIQRTTNSANGAVIEVMTGAYVYGKKYGLQVTGSINNKESTNLPRVHVAHGAEIEGGKDVKNVGIYASGYAIYTIEGTVTGATGVYAKGGQVTIDGATISSNADSYSEVVYHDGKNTSGTEAAGSAVIIEGSAGSAYTGGSLVVTGETTLESTYGYAVEGLNFEPEGDTKIEGITISSGTINGGNEGVLNLSVDVAEDVKQEGTITGGTYNGDVTDYLGDNTGIITQTTDEQGNTIWAVSEKEEGQNFETNLLAATSTSLVKQSTDVTLATLGETKELSVQYLAVQSNAVITIPDTYTLTAGEIVMSPTSKIVVEAGGSLVINGEQGIIANQATNIEIQTSETKPGMLWLHPAVTANRRPHATVQFFSKSWRTSNTEKVYQFFGLPATDITSFVSSTDAYQTAVYRMGSSSPIGIMTDGTLTNVAGLNSPYYIYYMLSTNDQDNKMTYTMQGKLLGNTNPVVDVESNWSPLANSYTGKINIDALLEKLATMHETTGVEPSVYAYTVIGAQKITWNVVNKILNQLDELNPMQPLMLMNRGGATTLDLNYQDLVWDPVFGSSPAPARHIGQNNMTKAIMRVTAEDGMFDKVAVAQSEDFTADYEAGYDAEKYMNEGMNIYVTDNVRLNVLASDNINNTYLGFQCAEAGTYTLSFDELQGENLVLVDLATGARMAMVEGAEYQFNADANEANDYRFEVVTIANMPTEIETIENGINSNIGAVYTVLGQYVGTMADWQNLPNGIYVVDGEKRVK